MRNLVQSVSTRTGAVKLSLAVVLVLIILKLVVSLISHSISISAQAADSLLDIFSIGITYVAVKMSVAPADEGHPFGHGKAEGLAALIQAILVLGAGGFIIYSSIQRLIHSTAIQPDEGMIVMVVSIVASFFLSLTFAGWPKLPVPPLLTHQRAILARMSTQRPESYWGCWWCV